MGIQTKTMKKRVSFSNAPHTVYIVDNYNRRGMWEHYALDRMRFERRIKAFEAVFKFIKDPSSTKPVNNGVVCGIYD